MKSLVVGFGPWALVTGASSGIGLEFAKQLASGGLNLLLVSRDQKTLEDQAFRLRNAWGVEVRTLGLDLALADSVETLMAWVGSLDVGLVISNAGAGNPAAFLELPQATHSRSFELNGLAHARLAYHFGPRLGARAKSGLLFVAAMGAQHGIPYMAADAAAKALVISLGRALHREWKDSGVHVTVVSPGPTETPVIKKLGFDGLSLPLKPASAASCVREGLRALNKNKPSIISGRLFALLGAFLPAQIWTSLNGAMLRKAAQVLALRRAHA